MSSAGFSIRKIEGKWKNWFSDIRSLFKKDLSKVENKEEEKIETSTADEKQAKETEDAFAYVKKRSKKN